MKPKEKAQQLVNDMQSSLYSDGWEDSKECARIAVFEILMALKKVNNSNNLGELLMFYYEVDGEIQKL